jgi:NAD kinase
MDLDNLVVIAGTSKYFQNLIKSKKSEKEFQKTFADKGLLDYLIKRHNELEANKTLLTKELGKKRVLGWSDITPELLVGKDLVAAVGGDDHFKYCSHEVLQYMLDHIGKTIYMAGVRGDSGSLGAILNFSVPDFLARLPDIKKDKYSIEERIVLESSVDNGEGIVQAYPSMAEVFVGEYCRLDMSRNLPGEGIKVYLDGKEFFPTGSSGILVVTPSGMQEGSWFNNALLGDLKEGDIPKTDEPYAKFLLTENRGKVMGTLRNGQRLKLTSNNDSEGILAPDSIKHHRIDFNMGSVAYIGISPLRLKVIYIND